MITTNFTFTNTAESAVTLKPTALGFNENYSLVEDEPGRLVLTNSTADVDAGERISFTKSKLAKVTTDQDVLYPARVQTGVQCQVRLEAIAKSTSQEDPLFRVDRPFVGILTIRDEMSGDVSDAMVKQVLLRMLGAVIKEDGTTRFSDMAKGALRPTVE